MTDPVDAGDDNQNEYEIALHRNTDRNASTRAARLYNRSMVTNWHKPSDRIMIPSTFSGINLAMMFHAGVAAKDEAGNNSHSPNQNEMDAAVNWNGESDENGLSCLLARAKRSRSFMVLRLACG